MGRFEGRVAIVTGAASGVGLATAERIAAEGGSVVLADINGEGVERAVASIMEAGGTAVAVQVDVSEEDAVRAMVEAADDAFGGVDLLHNNAAEFGLVHPDNVDICRLDASVWDRVMAVNARSVMLGCKHAIPRMLERGGGAIVNTASVSGLVGDVARAGYGASKAAVIALTKYVATMYGPDGVRCNAVAPGLILSPALAGLPEDVYDIFMANRLVPAPPQAADIAAAVVYLMSDDASQISGHTLVVDGGATAHRQDYAQLRALGKSSVSNSTAKELD